MRALTIVISVALTAACSGLPAGSPGDAALAAHPSQLQFEARQIPFPSAADYRYELVDGNVAYIVPDTSLPLIKLTVLAPGGSYLLDPTQAGLGGMTAGMLRDGGTADLTPSEVDERLDFLATAISFSIGTSQSSASLDTLSLNFDESLDLMFDMLSEPRLDAERLQINIQRGVEQMRRRNDDTRTIEPQVWRELIYGESFFANQQPTQATLEAITPDAIRFFASRIFARGRLVFAVSGDLDPARVITALNRELSRLPDNAGLPEVPDQIQPRPPGLYGVAKPDVNQTRVVIGHPGPRLHHPDEYAIAVMNEILGGGGFTSRITSRVRSDEGLAYSAGSSYFLGRDYPGQFRAAFQSKNESVPQALNIVLEEIQKIRSEEVSSEELNTAVESQIAFLADLYSSAARMAGRFANDELNEEDLDYWRHYEAEIRAVTPAAVKQAADKHIRPEELRILVVGQLDQALAGDGLHGGLEEVAGDPLTRISLKDPLTLEPLE